MAPGSPLTQSLLAIALDHAEDPASLEIARAAADRPSAGPAELNNLGYVLHRLGRDQEAIEQYNAAFLRAGCPYGPALFNRAMAWEQLRDEASAARDWHAYLYSNPRGRWAQIAREHLTVLEGEISLDRPTPEQLPRASLRPPAPLELWQSSSEVLEALNNRRPDEEHIFRQQEGKLWRYRGLAMTLLLEGEEGHDNLVTVELQGGAARDWLQGLSASVGVGRTDSAQPADPEQAVRRALGPPDMRRTEKRPDAVCLGYSSPGVLLCLRPVGPGEDLPAPGPPARYRLYSCAFIPERDASVEVGMSVF